MMFIGYIIGSKNILFYDSNIFFIIRLINQPTMNLIRISTKTDTVKLS